jgi:hypothetical protein
VGFLFLSICFLLPKGLPSCSGSGYTDTFFMAKHDNCFAGDEGDRITLVVADNGVGLPEGMDIANSETLGLWDSSWYKCSSGSYIDSWP